MISLHRPPLGLRAVGGAAQGTPLVPVCAERAGYLILGWWRSLGKNLFFVTESQGHDPALRESGVKNGGVKQWCEMAV